jgi:hypothetical protein
MARKPHKHHYIYKTTCKVTNRYYIGMHSTSNLEDGYIGSGKRLWYSIRKHGRENHEREIIEFLPDRKVLKEREKELVNESMLQDPMCMNLKIGGEGGNLGSDGRFFGGDRFNGAHQWWKNADRAITLEKSKHLKDPLVIEKRCQTRFEKTGSRNGWKGRKHSEESKRKMSYIMAEKQSGEKNSQFGTFWITNGVECKKIKQNQPIPDGWVRGRLKQKTNKS